MSGKPQHLKLQKDSAMGALHLVSTSPGRLPKDHPFAPCKAYLESLAAGGVRTQRVNLERAARYLAGVSIIDFDWRALTSADVEAVRSRLRLSSFSASTINGTLSALKGVARRAWRLEQMSVQELESIRDIQGVSTGHRVRPARALAFSEIRQLFKACDHAGGVAGARDACLFSLLYGAGLRANEAHLLNLADYNARSHTLRVHGKGDRDRTVYFREGGARRALHLWLRVRGRSEGALLLPVNRHGEILPRRLSYAGVYAALLRRARQSGLAHFTPHDLRRSIGTHLLDKTRGDLDLVREYLGHVDVRTTQLYIMRGDRARRLAAEKITVPFRTPRGGRGGSKRKRRQRGPTWKQQLRSRL